MGSLAEDLRRRLKQVLCDMEQAIVEMMARKASLAGRERRLSAELTQDRRLADKWLVRVAKALEVGDAELAHEASLHKDAYEKSAAGLKEEIHAARNSLLCLAGQIEVLKAKAVRGRRLLVTLTRKPGPASPEDCG